MTRVYKLVKYSYDLSPRRYRKLDLPEPTSEVREAWSVRSHYASPFKDEMYFDETMANKRAIELYNEGHRQAEVSRCAVVKCTDNRWRRINFVAVNIRDAALLDAPKIEPVPNTSTEENPES